jgi:hypothetical protein
MTGDPVDAFDFGFLEIISHHDFIFVTLFIISKTPQEAPRTNLAVASPSIRGCQYNASSSQSCNYRTALPMEAN